MEKAQLIVGFIRGSHGLGGECRVESASGEYEHLLKLKEVTLQKGGVQKAAKVESAVLGNSTLYAKFAGIDTPEEIRKYNGWEILAQRKYAKPLKKDEWYIEDLRNCSLVWSGGEPAENDAPAEIVGIITDVLEGGAGYLLQVSLSEGCGCVPQSVKFTQGGKPRVVLVPFTNEHIGKVDVKSETVQLKHLWILE